MTINVAVPAGGDKIMISFDLEHVMLEVCGGEVTVSGRESSKPT